MGVEWTDLNLHGRRLNRIIRRLEKKMKETKDIDKAVRCANAISITTREIVSIAKLHLGIEEVLKKHEKHIEND